MKKENINSVKQSRPISYKILITTPKSSGNGKNYIEAGFLNLKNSGIRPNGAYELAQKIKVLQV